MTMPSTFSAEGVGRAPVLPTTYADHIHANASADSWGAILVGATAAALSLILLMLGAGLGLSSIQLKT